MNRADLQALAVLRLDDAAALLDAGRYAGAYYLAGYAVECAIKACIARKTHEHDFPDLEFARQVYTHSLTQLMRLAELHVLLNGALRSDADLADNWSTVQFWSEQSRYEQMGEPEARDLHRAIADPSHGVLQWLRGYW